VSDLGWQGTSARADEMAVIGCQDFRPPYQIHHEAIIHVYDSALPETQVFVSHMDRTSMWARSDWRYEGWSDAPNGIPFCRRNPAGHGKPLDIDALTATFN
jgi:hypothetical protein